MKLYIDKDYVWSLWLRPTFVEQELDDWHDDVSEWCAVADKLGCSYAVDYTGAGAVVSVHQQKIVLSEVDMNTLFFDFLENMFTTKISYAPLGGEGCEFAMRLVLVPFVYT